jgi:diguanylate cyclase (GGDEF)-like protein
MISLSRIFTGWRIRHKLLLLALLPAVLVAVALGAYFINSGLGALDAELRSRGQATARYLAPASEYGMISGNRNNLQSLAQAAMREPDVQTVLIIDAAGHTLAASGRQGSLRFTPGLRGRVDEGAGWLGFSAPIMRSSVELDDYLDAQQESKNQHGADVLGQVYVELTTLGLQQQRAGLLWTGLAILFAGAVVAALLARRMAHSVSQPVMRLVEAVHAMEGGKLDTRVPASSSAEFAVLERGFNQMAAKLEDAHLTLEERIKQATAQLVYQAGHDSLTGLVNRREFEVRVESALITARAGSAEHAICFLDLDQFKIVNDTCGHAAGDELLRQITNLLKARVRDQDTLARLGGDEFGVLLEDCHLADALRVAEALRKMVEEFRFSWRDRMFMIGVSVGLVMINRESKSLAEVIGAADQACYVAKEKGRNRIQVFQLNDRELVERRGEMSWATRISQALEENRMLLYAQNIVPLNPSVVDGVHIEVLLRMQDEQGEIVPPRAFLPAAERYDLMLALDRWVISAACAGIRKYLERSRCKFFVCSINLSAQAVVDAEMPLWIASQLALYDVPPECLCVEISEAAASLNLAETMHFVQRLKGMGCRFALDDFGSGMASFSYLKNLPPDYVKIDGSIVREIVDSSISQTLLRAIHDIASSMGVQTIAESVDSPQMFIALRDHGIAYGQGHWFELPKPLNNWLDEAALCPSLALDASDERSARVIAFRGRGASKVRNESGGALPER